MESLKNWAYSVAVIVVFGTLVEYAVPSAAYRKYIHLAMGLLLILTLARPLLGVLDGGDEFLRYIDDLAERAYAGGVTSVEMRSGIETRQESDILEVYKRTLETNIKTRLEAKLDLSGMISDVRVEINTNESGYGEAEFAEVWLSGGEPDGVRAVVSAITGLSESEIRVYEE